MAVGRNAPCPCGSGKKYKVCCLNAAATQDRRTQRIMLFTTALSIVAGIIVGLNSTPKNGILTTLGILIVVFLIVTLTKPPPSRGKGGGDQINFGS
jgi:hypothetical protein